MLKVEIFDSETSVFKYSASIPNKPFKIACIQVKFASQSFPGNERHLFRWTELSRAANSLQGGEAQLLRGKEKVWIASNVCHPILTHSIPKKKASCHSPILYPGAALDLKIRLKVLFPTFRCVKQKLCWAYMISNPTQ